MSSHEIGNLAISISVLLLTVHLLGYLSEKLKQPRLIGEILAGLLLGPFVAGKFLPHLSALVFGASGGAVAATPVVLNFIYWIGLFLLMFLSGSETRRLLAKENRREIGWLFSVGTIFPFLLVMLAGRASMLPLNAISGPSGNEHSSLLILAVAVSVTSIPVISRIFIDLGIIQSRFASLVLAFAVLEDIVLWGAIAVATSGGTSSLTLTISTNLALTLAYMLAGLTVIPHFLRKVHQSRWNLLLKSSPVGYIFFILFLYISIAAALEINLVFAAFLAGFGVVGGMGGTERVRFSPQLEAISRVAGGLFVPLYFAVVGSKIILGRDFSAQMLLLFLIASSAVAMISFSVAAFCAGFRGLDLLNLAITKNARGGPGIVLASVAFDAGIINASFYTTLVLSAVFTSQVAGFWLRLVLSRGLPLLGTAR